jgi:hypothetical protein
MLAYTSVCRLIALWGRYRGSKMRLFCCEFGVARKGGWPERVAKTLVKRRRPTARRFYFTEPAVRLVYMFDSTHALIQHANTPPVAGYIDTHHAALSPGPRLLVLRPPDPLS